MRIAKVLPMAVLTLGLSVRAGGVPPLFDGALEEIGSKSTIPIYLPTAIPEVIAKEGVKLAVGELTRDGYAVSLYYSEETSDATLAGIVSFSRSREHLLPKGSRSPSRLEVIGTGGQGAVIRPNGADHGLPNGQGPCEDPSSPLVLGSSKSLKANGAGGGI